jgi:hypothetical protein
MFAAGSRAGSVVAYQARPPPLTKKNRPRSGPKEISFFTEGSMP